MVLKVFRDLLKMAFKMFNNNNKKKLFVIDFWQYPPRSPEMMGTEQLHLELALNVVKLTPG